MLEIFFLSKINIHIKYNLLLIVLSQIIWIAKNIFIFVSFILLLGKIKTFDARKWPSQRLNTWRDIIMAVSTLFCGAFSHIRWHVNTHFFFFSLWLVRCEYSTKKEPSCTDRARCLYNFSRPFQHLVFFFL